MQVLWSDLLQPVVFLQLAEKSVARLLCVAQEHSRVLVEEDRVVDRRIADAQGALHHDHLRIGFRDFVII